MSDNNLEHLFENLKNDFDIEAPRLQHEQRFVEKLNNQKSQISIVKNNAKRNSLALLPQLYSCSAFL